MVNKLNEKPKEYFNGLSDNCLYFEVLYKDRPYAYLAFQILNDSAIIHNEIIEWNHKIAKVAKIDFEYVSGFLKTIGIKKVEAFYPKIEKRWGKFIKIFGFSEPEYLMRATKEL